MGLKGETYGLLSWLMMSTLLVSPNLIFFIFNSFVYIIVFYDIMMIFLLCRIILDYRSRINI